MKETKEIAQCFTAARETWNPFYLAKAVYLIISQGRFTEVVYGLYCYIFSSPSAVNPNPHWNSLAFLDEKLKQSLFSARDMLFVKDMLSREEIVQAFGQDYAVHGLPKDFAGARIEGIAFSGTLLILGEYGLPGKRIAIVSKLSCVINNYYEKNSSVRHIHAICSASNTGSLLVATGDSAKVLDLWDLKDDNISLVKQMKKSFAGHTSILRMNGEYYYGTDFTSRPNYLEVFGNDPKKFFFPEKSYYMYVLRFVPIKNRYIACLSRELQTLGGRYALSVFDIEQKEFVFCDYVQYAEPETINKELYWEAITLRSIAVQ